MIFLKLSFAIFLLNKILAQELDQLDVLLDYLENQGNEAKVGFLSESNYLSVKRKLPNNTKPIIVEHESDLTQMVLNGTIIAALVSGLPETKYHDSLHIISSEIVTLHSILIAPDNSSDYPHGVSEKFSTYHLSMAINAAIAKIQLKGIDLKLAIKNAPKDIISAHTCKEDDQSQFSVPNKSEAKGFLKDIFDKKEIKVLANGPYNWGANDGNYLLEPPVGFFPDLFDAIIDEFKNLSGPDNEPYGDIKITRVYTKESPFPWYYLFDGTAHLTEPYFILDSSYTGSGKKCTNDQDCFNANIPGNKEKCNSGWCNHPSRPRNFMLRSSCTTLGSDSKFFTKRNTKKETSNSSLGAGIIVLIVLLVLVSIVSVAGIGFLIIREKRGKPVFVPFN